MLLDALGCEVPARLRVIAAAGEELQRQERMGGAALAEVELDRVCGPVAGGIPDDDEVDREPTEHAFPRKAFADRHGRLADQSRVGRVSGKQAAQIALAAGSTEQLIMRRQQFDPAAREHPQLHAGAEELLADDPLLDDAAILLELCDIRIERHIRRLKPHVADPLEDRRVALVRVDRTIPPR